MTNPTRARRALPLSTAAAVLISAAWLCLEAAAEQAAPPAEAEQARYAGTYRYAESLDHGRAIVRAAMEKAIEKLNPLVRPIARSKLASSDPLIREIGIALPEGRISVTLVGQKTATFSTKAGAREKVRNPQGKQVDLTQRFVAGGLEQVFVGEKGRTRSLYALQPDGDRLRVLTRIEGQGVDGPIAYRLDYVRR